MEIGPALKHYRCFQVVDTATKSLLISDTVEFRHNYLAHSTITHKDLLLHDLHFLSSSLKENPTTALDKQIEDISQLSNLF